MLEVFRPGLSLTWDLAWQATLFLSIGLVIAAIAARRPARAHWLLFFAMIAALATPLLAQAGRKLGWGLWTAPDRPLATIEPASKSADLPSASFPAATNIASSERVDSASRLSADGRIVPVRPGPSSSSFQSGSAPVSAIDKPAEVMAVPVNWANLLKGAWFLSSLWPVVGSSRL
jgi:hypothetical protein